MATTSYGLVGVTRRNRGSGREPLRHAFTWTRRSRWGRQYTARCGAGVDLAGIDEGFDPDHPRACRACARAVRPVLMAPPERRP